MSIRNLIIAAAVFIGFLVLLGQCTADAHDWYDKGCCDEGDCFQTGLGEVKREAEGWRVVINRAVEFLKGPQLVKLDVLIPLADIRLRKSQDPLHHVCAYPESFGGQTTGQWILRCLYLGDPGI